MPENQSEYTFSVFPKEFYEGYHMEAPDQSWGRMDQLLNLFLHSHDFFNALGPSAYLMPALIQRLVSNEGQQAVES
jgi:hypothetical protein